MKTLPMCPEELVLDSADLMYLCKATGAADRDKKITVETLRQFCTAQGVKLIERTLKLSTDPGITDIDVTSTANVVVIVWGVFLQQVDNRVNIHGTVPEGCSVTVFNGNMGLIDLYVNGNRQAAATADDLDFGMRGRAELVSHNGEFVLTIVNDSRWNLLKRDAAISTAVEAESSRAQQAEAALKTDINGEKSVRESADNGLTQQISQLGGYLNGETERATAAEAALATHRSHVVPQTVVLWTTTDIYSQDEGAIKARGPATASTSGVGVTSEMQKVIEGADSEVCPSSVYCWRPSGSSGPYTGVGNTMTSKMQMSLTGALGFQITGGSPLSRIAMLSWNRALGKVVVEKLPTSTISNPAATIGFQLPAPTAGVFEELLTRVIVGDDVSCEVVIQHQTNGQGISIPSSIINDGRNWWIRARHAADEDWKIDCWWEPKRI